MARICHESKNGAATIFLKAKSYLLGCIIYKPTPACYFLNRLTGNMNPL